MEPAASTERPPGAGRSETGRAASLLAAPPWLALASSIGGSVAGGIVAGGLGGRIVMRLSAIAAGEQARGAITENGNLVGDITGEGTVTLLLFGGVFAGLAGGPLLFALRAVLPRRFLPLSISIVLLALAGSQVIDPGNSDFVILGDRALNVAMFAALFALHALIAVWLAERLERWLLRPPLVHIAPLALVATIVGIGLGLLAAPAVVLDAGGLAGTTGTITLVVTLVLGTVVALDVGHASRRALPAARLTIAIGTAVGLVQLAADVTTIVA